MKNLKIFPKTFLYTFTILGSIVLIAHVLIYFLFPVFYLDDKKQELSSKANMIVESISRVNESSVESVLSVYAKNNKVTAFLKKGETSEVVKLGDDVNIDKDSTNNSIIIEDRKAETKDGKVVTFQVISGTETVKEATKVTLQFLPYTLMTTILFSIVFSYFYSKKLVKPLIEIAETTKKMQNLDRDARFKVRSTDEIGEVGVRINRVYEQLLSVIDDLEEKNKNMIRMEKMKVDFLRSASHELKTPLAGLRIILENMEYNVGKYKDRDKYLAESIDVVDHMTEIVMEILKLSKLQEWSSSDEEIFIGDEIDRVLEKYMALAANKDISISENIENIKIKMGRAVFGKAMSNLIGNAVKYTAEKGCIRIYTEDNHLIIENTCEPLSEEEISKAFEIFYHGNSESQCTHQGNGLGLYIVKNIMENYGFGYSFEAYERTEDDKIHMKNGNDGEKEHVNYDETAERGMRFTIEF